MHWRKVTSGKDVGDLDLHHSMLEWTNLSGGYAADMSNHGEYLKWALLRQDPNVHQ